MGAKKKKKPKTEGSAPAADESEAVTVTDEAAAPPADDAPAAPLTSKVDDVAFAGLRRFMPHSEVAALALMPHHFLATTTAAVMQAPPADEAPAFDEAAELKKKQEDLARKAAEAAEAEDERNRKAMELEASGKKAAGGLHKFDAS